VVSPQRMRTLFCGTPQFAVATLKHLLAQPDFEIIGVITQPDRPRGRGQELSFSAIKTVAMEAGIAVHQPEKIRSAESQELLEKLAPNVVVIIAYGQIIPAKLLAIPKFGWINLHSSLLPQYRGAAPVNWAIVNGDSQTGVTTMRIDPGMDTGDILLQRGLAIGPSETAPELAARLSQLGAPLVTETLRGLASGTLVPKPQDHTKATPAPLLTKEHGRIDWSRSATEIFNRMRGFAPWPGAYSTFRGQTCHLWGEPVSPLPGTLPAKLASSVPGEILQDGHHLFIACGRTTVLSLRSVKLEGRKLVSASEFANGARLKPGEGFVAA
jgi:methionyl-tRNA formyltransferase